MIGEGLSVASAVEELQLTEIEHRLVRSVVKGEVLDLTDGEDDFTDEEMGDWTAERTVRAQVLRAILLGRLADCADPYGIRVRGARVAGRLDLRHVESELPLYLADCFLEDGADAGGARLRELRMVSCRIDGPVILDSTRIGGALDLSDSVIQGGNEAALYAPGLRVEADLVLTDLSAAGGGEFGLIELMGAHVGGSLFASGVVLKNEEGPTLAAVRMVVGQRADLRRLAAEGAGRYGAVNLGQAQIGGDLDLSGGTLSNQSGSALMAPQLSVGLGVVLKDGFTATGSGIQGAVCLVRSEIRGPFEADGAKLHNDSGPALRAAEMVVSGQVLLTNGFAATGAGGDGTVNLALARISGELACNGANLENQSGPALVGVGMRIDGALLLRSGFAAKGASADGALILSNARIGIGFYLDNASVGNADGPAVAALGMHVDGLMLFQTVEVTGAGSDGAIDLTSAHIKGDLLAGDSTITNPSGPAIHGITLAVDGSLQFHHGFAAAGSGPRATVQLANAQVGADVHFAGVELTNDSGAALSLYGLKADDVLLHDSCTFHGSSADDGTVMLTNLEARGVLAIQGSNIVNEHGSALEMWGVTAPRGLVIGDGTELIGDGGATVLQLTRSRVGALSIDLSGIRDIHAQLGVMDVDGLIYTELSDDLSVESWLAVLRHRTRVYAAQPYQQLTAISRAAGHDREARRVLIAQREDQLRRGPSGGPERVWGMVTKIVLGYGYRPHRALLGLLGVLGVAVGLTAIVGGPGGGLSHRQPSGAASSCTMVERIGVGLDLGLPLVKTGARDTCVATATTAGQTITVALWLLQAAAWALATLFIAGFTGAVRKT